ncbi:M4 family metallopeptidase [Polyangium sp. 6x1]|uniref:M4 family metallopeptidase n=1 Tax=Polyangium sp. 6x1 TaxID=3042689 RepID=UPI002482A727|nr:M4 family metallopeptidase [Polyangium sp. 6x1]MDI1447307.1 M4 family metallopeptidase [Polyangium sp. 6x1]
MSKKQPISMPFARRFGKTLGGLSLVLGAGCAVSEMPEESLPEGRMEEAAATGQRPVFTPSGDADQHTLAEAISRAHIAINLDKLGLTSEEDVAVKRVRLDELSLAHTRMQQKFKGVPVFEGEAIVHLDRNGQLSSVTDGFVKHVRRDLSVKPTLSEKQAIGVALDRYGCESCLTAAPEVDLLVMRHEGQDHLAYRVRLRRIDSTRETAMPVIFLDAHSGEEIHRYDNLQTAQGSSLYSGTVTIGTSSAAGKYYLEDLTRKVGTFTYSNGTSTVYRLSDTDNIWSGSDQRVMVDAQYGAAMVYDYYKNVHGRNGIDGAGGPTAYTAANGGAGLISSVIRYSTSYNNAFWDGSKMTYGDGDGSTFSPLVSVDIAAHEMTHGVTEYEADLTYENESGALNESWSDVFGALVERYVYGESADTWKIGEDCYTPGTAGDALRYMDTPHNASNSGYTSNDDPDHYSERYTGTEDNGGVHINSGIPNHAFYLLAKGGTHHLSGVKVTGIGADDAGKIWYKALADYMTASTNFAGARQATLSAASALFGASSAQYASTQSAWCAVGVGECPGASGGGGGGTNLLANGTFEGSSSPWVLSGTGALYTNNGNYPQSGTGYPYFGNAVSVSGSLYQQLSIPAGASPTLTFYLNVTSAETTTTTQYDQLFVELRSTSGTLLKTLATYSNLNKGTAGAYALKSLSLAGYGGQTVRLQFRTTNDSLDITTFRVDSAEVK